MADVSAEGWFYTKEGERVGPVEFEELKRMAREGLLSPRWDMVWTQRMGDWKPAGEVEGLYDKEGVRVEREELAPPAESFVAPQVESVAQRMGRVENWTGVGRRGFFVAVMVFPVVWQLLVPRGAELLVKPLGPEITGFLQVGFGFLPALVGVWFTLKRLTNLGMSQWWILGLLVPLLNFWVIYRLFACPAGYAYHRKLDAPGVVLAIIHWLLVAAVVAVTALAVMEGKKLANSSGRRDLDRQFRHVIERVREAVRIP